jgi:hypothetical protein
METVEWRAPTWSWANYSSKLYYSLLSKFHEGHSSRHSEAELLELNVRAKAPGELENASMMIKCKPLHAILTPAAASTPLDNDLHGILELIDLELIDQDGEILQCRTLCQIANPEVEFCVDDNTKIREPQYGHVVVLQQHCHHEEECTLSDDTEGSETKEGEEGFSSEEDSEGPGLEEQDCLEALFLQMRDQVADKFERTGLISFYRFRAVNQVLKAHRMAEDKVITLSDQHYGP